MTLENAHYVYREPTGDRVLHIQWSGRGHASKRQMRWGGKSGSWKMTKIGEGLYVIPRAVTLDTIHDALMAVLLPSDRATLTYPYGNNKEGHSVMRIRLYGQTATENRALAR